MNAKITLSPAQALLILIAKKREQSQNFDDLLKIYLQGASQVVLKPLLNDDALSNYYISFEPKIINDDPCRRYFESHLALYSLKEHIKYLDRELLEKYCSDLYEFLPSNVQNEIEHVLQGQSYQKDSAILQEYSYLIQKSPALKMFKPLSIEDKKSLVNLFKCAFLAVQNAQHNKSQLPLDIYGKGLYSSDKRGKELYKLGDYVKNKHLGLMKGHMAIPRDSLFMNKQCFPFLKPSDQASYRLGADWVTQSFNQSVHPFVNAISGTFLAQLNNLIYFAEKNVEDSFLKDTGTFMNFVRVFMCTMMASSGGHSFFEFIYPMKLPTIQAKLAHLYEPDSMNVIRLFFDDNQTALHNALEDSIEYNQVHLSRLQLKDELESHCSKTCKS